MATMDLQLALRDTLAFVTNPAGVVSLLTNSGDFSAFSYPTTLGGYSLGYTSLTGSAARDRDATIPRLAGLHRDDSGSGVMQFRINLLDASQVTCNMAFGDSNGATVESGLTITDGTNTLFTLAPTARLSTEVVCADLAVVARGSWDESTHGITFTPAVSQIFLNFPVAVSGTAICNLQFIRIRQTSTPTAGRLGAVSNASRQSFGALRNSRAR